jgi:hypothetical protein
MKQLLAKLAGLSDGACCFQTMFDNNTYTPFRKVQVLVVMGTFIAKTQIFHTSFTEPTNTNHSHQPLLKSKGATRRCENHEIHSGASIGPFTHI